MMSPLQALAHFLNEKFGPRVDYWLLTARTLPWNWVWVGRWARKHDKEEQG